MGSHPACLPASHSRPSRFARAARVVALATATGLLSGCGVSASAPAGSARAHSHTQSAISTPTPASALASYCDARDTPIPGATSALANGDLSLPNLTAIEQAWFQMYATMVPACSEITPHPLPVETKNLTNGQLSDAELATWVQLDSAGWALWEWAGQHDQFEFMRFLLPSGNDVTAFIELGGSVVDENPACEYPSKVYAVSITGDEMSQLTGAHITTAGIGYALAWLGPCTTAWTSASGQVQEYPIGSGSEYRELEVTETKTSPALGDYLETEASVNPSAGSTAEDILQESGV